MAYKIYITNTAKRDMSHATKHIEFVLKNPKAANDLLNEINTKINDLISFPERYPLIDDPILSLWKIRFLVIKNYLAFYIIDKEKKSVFIIRFLYQKSNWKAVLYQTCPPDKQC